MADLLSRFRRFFRELKRRKVYRVAATYLAVAFVGFQAVKLLIPSTTLPPWADELMLAFLIVGFPVSLVIAWAFEVTPEGIQRTGSASYDGEGGQQVASKAPAHSIAVLPFTELGEEEAGTFTEGMHDALLTRLSNIGGLMVISRTSVQKYRSSGTPTSEIARELGVRWVVEGGVQEMGDQIQVNAQLVDPSTSSQTWADSYRRRLTAENLFAIQTEITRKIVDSLQAELSRDEEERIARQPTDELAAYRLYLKGRVQLERRSENGLLRAEGYFKEAIREDPKYALAYTGLADSQTLLAGYYLRPPRNVVPKGKEAIRKALEIDPDLGEARASRGLMLYIYDWEFDEAGTQFERALKLSPNYATAHHWYGLYFLAVGRLDEALDILRAAEELDPHSEIILTQTAFPLAFQGRFEEAEAQYQKALDLDPRFAPAHSWLGLAYADEGRFEEGIRECTEAVAISGRFSSRWIGNLAYVHATAGQDAEALELLEDLRERADEEYVSPRLFVPAFAQLDDLDEAFNWLERACEERSYFLSLTSDPRWDALRQDQRFSDILRRMGLPSSSSGA